MFTKIVPFFLIAVTLMATMIGCGTNRTDDGQLNAATFAVPETVKVSVPTPVPTPMLFPAQEISRRWSQFASTGYLYVQRESNTGLSLYLLKKPDDRHLFSEGNYVPYGTVTLEDTKISVNRHGMSTPYHLLGDYNYRMVTITGRSKGVKPYEGEGGTHYEGTLITELEVFFH